MMDGLQIPIPRRILLIRFGLVLSIILNVLLSFGLWTSSRNFPLSPLFDWPPFHSPFDLILPILLIVTLLISLFAVRTRLWLALAFLLLLWLICLDVNRLQFWTYAYAGLLLVLIFYNGRVDDSNRFTAFFIVLQSIVAAVYFFSGLHQLNPFFVSKILPELLQGLHGHFSERQFQLFIKIGQAVPFTLIFVGLGLMISAIRYLAIAVALLFHVLLLVLLFPASSQPDFALWFGNFSFAFLIFLLFSGKTKQRYFSPSFLFQMPVFYVILFGYLIMPFFNEKDNWPDALSFNFYSGSTKQVEITIGPKTMMLLPSEEAQYYEQIDLRYRLNYQKWCRQTLHAQFVASERVFNSIYNHLKVFSPNGVKEVEMHEIPRQTFLGKP